MFKNFLNCFWADNVIIVTSLPYFKNDVIFAMTSQTIQI